MTQQTGSYRAALADAETAGGVLAVANPEGARLLITRLILDVQTAATAACTVNAGVAADGTTGADDLIDGLDVNTAAGVFDNVENPGTNGKAVLEWGASEYVTISKATGAAAGLAGYAHIEYVHA